MCEIPAATVVSSRIGYNFSHFTFHSRADFLMNCLFKVLGVDDRPGLADAIRRPIRSDHFYFGFARVHPVKSNVSPR